MVIKVVEKARGSKEAQTIMSLQRLPSTSRSPVIPAELVECEKSTLILMPYLPSVSRYFWAASEAHSFFLYAFTQMIAAVEALHNNNIAHLDIAITNFTFVQSDIKFGSVELKKDDIYLIDFDTTKHFESGPGSNITVTDFHGGHYAPPEGPELVDPYAYDVFSLGMTLRSLTKFSQYCEPEFEPFIETLSAKDPKQRPSIHQVQRKWRSLLYLLRPRILLQDCVPI
ncbi:kinase-like domain-containing protein [Cristinia sonorae]|uniref:Kinase-like domain-containing protein n=1 Tax=Cristinia sonorae TaxID=1940300 RepID=A0A8K0UNT9_9AGAR|nr:kinase-like domain-containing protein [Cristinia sonorae]